MDVRMDHEREATDTAVQTAEIKRENLVGTLKNQTYKDLADIKRKASAEMARVRSEGEHAANETSDQYKSQVDLAQYEGQKKLRETLKRDAQQQEYLSRAADNERQILARSHQEEMQALVNQNNEARSQLQEQGEREINAIQEKTAAGRKSAENHFEGVYSQTLKTNADALARESTEAKRQLDQLRADHSVNLARYEERLKDPFYRMVDLNLSLRDHGDYYTLKANVPEYEREHLKVTVRGNEVVVSGARRNEEKLDLGEGRSRTIASFQSYQESLPLEWPVEPHGMLREFDGDQVVVTLPKRGIMIDPMTGEKKSLQTPQFTAVRGVKPDFPSDMPKPAPQRSDRPLSRS
jgi:HSP20 family molecular chaperone IbpA